MVREIEVEPVSAEDAAADAPVAAPAPVVALPNAAAAAREGAPAAAKGPAQTPLVPKSTSRFTVTVEHLELLTPPPAEGGAEATNP